MTKKQQLTNPILRQVNTYKLIFDVHEPSILSAYSMSQLFLNHKLAPNFYTAVPTSCVS